jgi:hypothetical protein
VGDLKNGEGKGKTNANLSKTESDVTSDAVFPLLSVLTVAVGNPDLIDWLKANNIDIKFPPVFTYIYEFCPLLMDEKPLHTVCTICRQSSQLGRHC